MKDNAGEQKDNRHRYFPMFIDSEGQRVLVIGGGNVAQRRVMTLLEFGFEVIVIAEQLTDELRALAAEGMILYIKGRCFVDEKPQVPPGKGTGEITQWDAERTRMPNAESPGDLENIWIDLWTADIILACTDDRKLNKKIGAYARKKGIPVNVCDAREESSFWFPAVALNEELTMGLVGTGEDHTAVRKAAAELRKVIRERSYEK